jgi:hypothetical protein
VKQPWIHKTTEQLEMRDFGHPAGAPTTLVKRCLELCRVPVAAFSIEDLRLMIGQELALPYLIPLAIEQLKADLLAEGDLYPGDLLKSVLSVHASYWEQYPQYKAEVEALLKDGREMGLIQFAFPE